ncbi:hypothetical protein D3C86_1959710 [compost metagenome]
MIVAHRTGILNVADRLLVLREGQVEMVGPRGEVIAKMAEAAQNQAKAAGAKPGGKPAAATNLQAAKP